MAIGMCALREFLLLLSPSGRGRSTAWKAWPRVSPAMVTILRRPGFVGTDEAGGDRSANGWRRQHTLDQEGFKLETSNLPRLAQERHVFSRGFREPVLAFDRSFAG